MRSPSLPNRTGGSPASGFPVGSRRWAGSGRCSEMFGGNTPAAQSFRTRSPGYGRPTASRRYSAKRFSATPTRSALRHYVGPRELASFRLPALPSYVPWLHDHYSLLRYYGRSDPGRPFRHHPPWFPDSRHQNFPPFCLQPSAVLDQTRSTALTLAALFVRASPCGRRLARTADRIEFTLPVSFDGRRYGLVVHFQLLSTRGCRPDAVTFSYWPFSVSQVRDSHPAVPVRSQAHDRKPSRLAPALTVSGRPGSSSTLACSCALRDGSRSDPEFDVALHPGYPIEPPGTKPLKSRENSRVATRCPGLEMALG
jgi:hypothetical protein